ncbi:MAG: hypothetical protein QOH39_772 [Verrucomicrobiota bacterium]|jgi:ligand-binding SRPBCC domain-containing protein
MPVIELSTEIHAPVERVFDLSRTVDLHMASTAHTGECAVAGVSSGLMAFGQEVTWRARHFGVWQHLTSRITAFDRPAHFRDSLVRGIFRRFDHDHFFAATGSGTLMRDAFDFQSPFSILGRIADSLFLVRYMTRLLATRNTLIKTVAESDEWRRYVHKA